jgi:RNA polymerase sigma-B factor
MIAPPISGSSEELFERWRDDRDPRARAQLVDHFMPLARKLARRYLGAGEPLEDLLQVASLGLLKAIDRFDPGRGLSFTSFAVPTILGELKRYFRDSGWSVHVPGGLQELALKVQQASAVLSAGNGRSPTIQELAQYLEISIENVIDALQTSSAHHATSLETPVGDSDGSEATLGDTLGADDGRFELVDDSVTISHAAGALSVRERTVLAQHFLEDRTQAEIASRIKVSQMQVSRILRQAIAQLRQERAQSESHPAMMRILVSINAPQPVGHEGDPRARVARRFTLSPPAGGTPARTAQPGRRLRPPVQTHQRR